MNTERLIESIFVGDATTKDFYEWASATVLLVPASENVNVVLGIASGVNPDNEELFVYFKHSLADLGADFPTVSRADYLLSRFKKEFESLIYSITEEELRFIANADYGRDFEEHYAGLKNLIFERGGIYSGDLYWFPYEVIELTRWNEDKAHQREFAISNCIIAQSIIAGTDISNDPGSMLSHLMPSYTNLPEPLNHYVIEHVRFSNRCYQVAASEKWSFAVA